MGTASQRCGVVRGGARGGGRLVGEDRAGRQVTAPECRPTSRLIFCSSGGRVDYPQQHARREESSAV